MEDWIAYSLSKGLPEPAKKPNEHKLFKMINNPYASVVKLVKYDLSRMSENRSTQLFGGLGESLLSELPDKNVHTNAVVGLEFNEESKTYLDTIESSEDWAPKLDEMHATPITDLQAFATYYVEDGTIYTNTLHQSPQTDFDFIAPVFPVSYRQCGEGAPFQVSDHINYHELLYWTIDKYDTAITKILNTDKVEVVDFQSRFTFPLLVAANSII